MNPLCKLIERPLYQQVKLGQKRPFFFLFKWRIFSRPGKLGSGKNTKYFFPTELEGHLEDMF